MPEPIAGGRGMDRRTADSGSKSHTPSLRSLLRPLGQAITRSLENPAFAAQLGTLS
jgi:hypothetical protein